MILVLGPSGKGKPVGMLTGSVVARGWGRGDGEREDVRAGAGGLLCAVLFPTPEGQDTDYISFLMLG